MLRCNPQRFDKSLLIKPKRLVFFENTSKVNPIQGLYEHQQIQAIEAANDNNKPYYNFHGFHIMQDQAFGDRWIQVREDIRRSIEKEKNLKSPKSTKPGRKAGLQILDEAIDMELRVLAAKRKSIEKQKMSYRAKKWEQGKGFLKNVLSVIPIVNKGVQVVGWAGAKIGLMDEGWGKEDEAGMEVRKLYGPDVNIDERRKKLAKDVLKDLDAAQRAAISVELMRRGVAVPAASGGVDSLVLQLAEADAEQLLEVRAALSVGAHPVFPPLDLKNYPLYPGYRQDPPETSIDKLIELRQIDAERRTKLLMTTVTDTQRLHRDFLDPLQLAHPEVYKLLTEKVLEDSSLYPLENHAEALGLVTYLEQRWHRRGKIFKGGGAEDLKAELQHIYDNKMHEEEEHHGEKKDEHGKDEHGKEEHGKEGHDHHEESDKQKLEKVKAALKKAYAAAKILRKDYAMARVLGKDIITTKLEHDKIPEAKEEEGGGKDGKPKGKPKDKNAEMRQMYANHLKSLKEQKKPLLEKIYGNEEVFKDGADEMIRILNGIKPFDKLEGDEKGPLVDFVSKVKGLKPFTPEERIFGITESGGKVAETTPTKDSAGEVAEATPKKGSAIDLLGFIEDFDDEQNTALEKSIDKNYGKDAEKKKKKKRLSPRQLLRFLKEGDEFRQGVTNEEQAAILGSIAADKIIDDVDHEKMLKVFRQTTQEVSEHLGATTLGSRRLNRLGKWLGAKLNIGGIYEAEDIVNYVAGFDKEYAMFKDMSLDITMEEFIDLIEKNGGINILKLSEFAQKLIEVYQSFQLLNTDGKVELWENHAVKMEKLIGMILMTVRVLQSQERANKNRKKILELVKSGKPVNKGKILLESYKEDEMTELKAEKDLVGQLANKFADWKQLFSKKVLKHRYLGALEKAREEMSAKNMNYRERQEYLKEKGLLTAFDALRTTLYLKEAYDVGAAAGGWTWNKLKGGKDFTYKFGADTLNDAWNSIVKPVGKAGKFVLWDVPTAPIRFGLKTAYKVASFPFNLADKIYQWAKPKSKKGGGHAEASAHGGHAEASAHGGHAEASAHAANDNHGKDSHGKSGHAAETHAEGNHAANDNAHGQAHAA